MKNLLCTPPLQKIIRKELFDCLICFLVFFESSHISLLFNFFLISNISLLFDTVHNKYKGVTLQAFLIFFPKNDPCQLKRAPLF